MRLGGDGLVELSKEELIAEHKRQESYIATLLSKLDGSSCGSGESSCLPFGQVVFPPIAFVQGGMIILCYSVLT